MNPVSAHKENTVSPLDAPESRRLPRWLAPVLLALLLASAAAFRFYRLNWDEMQLLHPDERFLCMVTASLKPVSSVGGYFDTQHSTLNPANQGYRFFVYGTLPVFIVHYIASLLRQTNLGEVAYLGRQLSATADFASVILVCFMGLHLYGLRVALLTTAFASWTVLSIQHSHFYTVDAFANFFVVATLFCLVQGFVGRHWWPWLVGGAALGLGLACKVSLLPLVVLFPLSALLQIPADFSWKIRLCGMKALLAAAMAILCFRIFQPYAFTGPHFWNLAFDRHWVETILQAQSLVSGEVDIPPGHQWTGRAPIVFPWLNMMIWGMGIPLGVTATAGWAWMGWRILQRQQKRCDLLLWLWISGFFLYQGSQWVKSMRYLLPVYPGLALLAAWLLDRIIRARRGQYLLGWGACSVVLIGTMVWALAFCRIYSQPTTRVAASHWIYDRVPHLSAGFSPRGRDAIKSGQQVTVQHATVIATEHWDDSLPVWVAGRTGEDGYKRITSENYSEDSPEKLERLVTCLGEADYVVLSSNRLYASIPRLPMRYPMTAEYYRSLFDGRLGFALAAEFSSYPGLGPLEFPDQESTKVLDMPNPFDRRQDRFQFFLPPAEEAFSVYDHPRVLIYRKTADFSVERAKQILGRFDLTRTLRMRPKEATVAGTGLTLDISQWKRQEKSGTWSKLFNRSSWLNRHSYAAVLAWWLLALLSGFVTWPLLFAAAPELPDRGWGLSKTLGLLVISYIAWLLASWDWLPFSRLSIITGALLLVLAGATIARSQGRAMLEFVRRRWKLLLIEEVTFCGTFGLFLLIRFLNSDLWHPTLGGERPMDFAYLNAVLKTTNFPPYDPWFSGGMMNYYYFGYVMAAVPIKLLQIVPATAYNLVLAGLAALTAVGAFSVGYNLKSLLSRSSSTVDQRRANPVPSAAVAGLLAMLFTVFIGNLGELALLLQSVAQLSPLHFVTSWSGLDLLFKLAHGIKLLLMGAVPSVPIHSWYWSASRLLNPGEISEFPFFSFLYSDLHPHLMALPITVLMLGTGLAWATRRRWVCWDGAVSLLIGALVVGAARVTNTWDYPVYLAIAFLALATNAWDSGSRINGTVSVTAALIFFVCFWITPASNDLPTLLLLSAIFVVAVSGFNAVLGPEAGVAWRQAQILWITTTALSLVLFWPFRKNFASGYQKIEVWTGATTSIGSFVLVFGIFLFLLALYLVSEAKRTGWRRWFRWRGEAAWTGILGVGGLALVFQGRFVAAILVPLLFLILIPSNQKTLSPGHRFLLLVLALALSILLGVEVFVVGGDVGRMNTVFKYYLVAWVLISASSAVCVGSLIERRPSPVKSLLWSAPAFSPILAGLLYPLLATPAKIRDRFDPQQAPGIDSMQFMKTAEIDALGTRVNLGSEYEALLWMQNNIVGTPIVAEAAAAFPYRSLRGRVATYTGLPVLVGYESHERQQRAILPESVVSRRVSDVNQLFSTSDIEGAWKMIKVYGVRYIIVGDTERSCYPEEGLEKFERMATRGLLKIAYRNKRVSLYEVVAEEPQELRDEALFGCLFSKKIDSSQPHKNDQKQRTPLRERGNTSGRCGCICYRGWDRG